MMKKMVLKHIKSVFLSCTARPTCLLACAFLLFNVSHAIASPDKDIKRIQDVYESIKDMKGNFIQKSSIKDLKRTDTYKGKLFIKQPMKMKWSYDGTVNQEVFINGDEIIIYQKNEKQAFRGTFDTDTYGRAPIALLSGFGKIQEEFSISGKNGMLLLKPKKQVSGIKSIELELCREEFPIRSFTIYDSHENKIVITLENIKINTGLKDSIFVPSLPKDTTFFEHGF